MHVHRIYGVKLLESVQFSCKGVQQQRSSTYATKWSLISTKTHPVDALRQTLNPPLHLRAFASQYLPCPFQTQQHDNQPFISVLPISFHPPSPPPFAVLLAIQTWKLCWMTPRFRHSLVSRATSSLLTFQKKRGEKKPIFVWKGR